jgi:GDPmannose 4,6-dehydratase
MKAVIFGASGQDGFYLKELLARERIKAFGVSRTTGEAVGSVTDRRFVENIVRNEQPDYIFHFAANSTTSHEALFENHDSICTGTLNILESARLYRPQAKVFLSGSAVQFENSGAPIDEQTPFAARSAYAASRIYSVYAARYFRKSFGLKIYVGYFFNHDSPRRSQRHINQKIAQAAKRIAAGSPEKLEIGDPTVRKEFNFAGDAIAAVWTLVNQNQIFEAVIGSGKARAISEWLDLCFGQVNLNWKDYVALKKDFKSEYQILVSNPALITSLGWRPRTDIVELARMMMAD